MSRCPQSLGRIAWSQLVVGLGAVAMAFAYAPAASAATITFTAIGSGGQSGPVAGFSDSSFWWADTTGGVSGAALSAYGFNPVTPSPGGGVWGVDYGAPGSYLLSSEFDLVANESLTIDLSVMTSHSSAWDDIGFAVLVQDSTVRAVLANTRPDGINHIGDFGSIPGTTLTPVSQGVASTVSTGDFLMPAVIGTGTYGQVTGPGDCFSGRCVTNITSSITPGAGTYQLIVGSFGPSGPYTGPSAVAVKAVNTPEPGTLILIGLGIAGSGLGRRLSQRRITH